MKPAFYRGIALCLLIGCGDDRASSASASASATATVTATATGSTSSTTGMNTASGGDSGGETSTGPSTGSSEDTEGSTTAEDSTTASSSTTDAATDGSTDGLTTTGEMTTEGSTSSSTGDDMCFVADVEDTLGFTYSKSIDLADINTIQASYYNLDASEIVFLSFTGQGRRFTIDGAPLGDVQAPPEALPQLDGATYDQVNKVALLITQGCKVVEADPVTLATMKVIDLDAAEFMIGVCAGVAIGVDGNMYVISWQTREMVTLTRDGQTLLDRVDLLALDLDRPDGISLIAGSENFLVLSSTKQQAAILSAGGEIIVPPGAVGEDVPPLMGGMVPNSDAILTVCGNGHAWVCDEYGTKCHDYVPDDGDKDACACTIPQ